MASGLSVQIPPKPSETATGAASPINQLPPRLQNAAQHVLQKPEIPKEELLPVFESVKGNEKAVEAVLLRWANHLKGRCLSWAKNDGIGLKAVDFRDEMQSQLMCLEFMRQFREFFSVAPPTRQETPPVGQQPKQENKAKTEEKK
jgi:hypothetical protein